MKESSQKFIARNNAPRVQIEYDVEIYGSQKRVNLPFVTGVMADLSGDRDEPLPSLEERSFANVDIDNFDEYMASIEPRIRVTVDDTIAGEGQSTAVDLAFQSLDDFSPGALARRIPSLARLLQAREQLTQLVTYMDGKVQAEGAIRALLENPQQLRRLASDSDSQDSANDGEQIL